MAFIKNTERKHLIKKINQSYAFRKFLISIEIAGLIGFIIVTFLSYYYVAKTPVETNPWAWFIQYTSGSGTSVKITGMGIGMLIWAAIIAILGIISLILTFSIVSPKTTKKIEEKLQSSALSGKKVKKSATNVDTNRSRTEMKDEKKK